MVKWLRDYVCSCLPRKKGWVTIDEPVFQHHVYDPTIKEAMERDDWPEAERLWHDAFKQVRRRKVLGYLRECELKEVQPDLNIVEIMLR